MTTPPRIVATTVTTATRPTPPPPGVTRVIDAAFFAPTPDDPDTVDEYVQTGPFTFVSPGGAGAIDRA